jgi:aspartyl-tRNA(Asn)/glutamyl-tRNA(Gln) amidotransferase subunit A
VSDTHWLTASEIGAAYDAGALSPVELVRQLLDRIATYDGQFNAFVAVDAQAALDQARLAENELRAGRRRGPLHGVPIGIKDLIDVAGQPTTCHSKILVDNIAARDAFVVARLRAAGAIILGKLALHEFAIGGPASDLPFPAARNPWNIRHHAGGSSSGSGAALAAGFTPLALGTDTGGSIRNPAGHCGVVGLKPTYGLVSRRGVFPLCFTLDHVGPMTRSVNDAALTLDALAAHDTEDPGSASNPGEPYGKSYASELGRGVRGLRFGVVRHFHENDMRATDDVAGAIDDTARLLREAGADVCDIQLPRLQEFMTAQRVIFHAESWAVHAKWLRERPEDYSRISRRKLMPGAFLSAGEYVQAQQRRAVLIDSVNAALRDVDILIVANSLDPACEIDDEEECTRTYGRHARSPFNLTGHPALAMMCGLSADGLPLSVQFVGRAYDEMTVLRVGAAFERMAKWHERHPAIAAQEG